MDATDGEELGPLATIEKAAVDFFDSILSAENERFATGTIRPKDLDEGKRGPLGKAEAQAVAALEVIRLSEILRVGLPGPANTQPDSRTRVRAVSAVTTSTVSVRYEATPTARPTLLAK